MSLQNRSRRGGRLGLAALVLLAVAAAFALRFRALGETTAVASVRQLHVREGVPVETVRATRHDLATWTTLAGTVEGAVQYPVVSSNALRVVGIPVRAGDRVAAGDVVLRLADEAPSPMYHSVAQARASYQNALADVRRLRNLFAEGAISRQELDHAETRLEVAAAQLADAEGSTALTASAPGRVTAVLTEEGATVRTGTPLLWIARTDTVKVVFQAGSRQALRLRPGQQAAWTAPDGTVREGVVSELDLMADPATHLLAGEARFANPGGRLVPGLLVSFDVRTAHRPEALAVPLESVAFTDRGAAVWLVAPGDSGPVARHRAVQSGVRTRDLVEITGGLEAGDQVVQFGQSLLQDGAPVQVMARREEG